MSEQVDFRSSIGTFLSNTQASVKEYGSARSYADEVGQWVACARQNLALQHHFSCWWMMHSFQQQQMAAHASALSASQQQPFLFQQGMPSSPAQNQQQQQQQPQNNDGAGGGGQPQQQQPFLRLNIARLFQAQQQQQLHPLFGGIQMPLTLIVEQCTVPSLMRRACAELIDFALLFVFKLFIILMLIEFEMIDIDQFEKAIGAELDLASIVSLTRGVFYLEILFKVFTGLFEAFCITFGLRNYPTGCTPGKFAMRIRVVACVDIQPIAGANDGVLAVTHFPMVPLKSSILRSVLKNLLTVFLFPLSLAFYTFNYNRAIYDLVAGTIVVNV